MDDRQKLVLKKFENEDIPTIYDIEEFRERDFADRSFAIAVAKLLSAKSLSLNCSMS